MPSTSRQPGSRPVLVRSVALLRAIATGVTLLSLAGMSAYAGDHLHSASAPLQPTNVAAAAATLAPTTTATTRTTLRQVTTTTRAALTRTKTS